VGEVQGVKQLISIAINFTTTTTQNTHPSLCCLAPSVIGPLPPPAGTAVPGPEPTSTCGEVAPAPSDAALVANGPCGEGEGVLTDAPLVPATSGILDAVDKTSLVERAREEGPEEEDEALCGGCG
jgi:hypothetical protein